MRQSWNQKSILEWAKQQKEPFSSSDLVRKFGMSRQTAARILSNLSMSGLLLKEGSTRSAKYSLQKRKTSPSSVHLIKKIKGLAEDKVFDEINLRLGLSTELSKNIYSIAYYAFTEMLNNAIDHSNSDKAMIDIEINHQQFQFKIRDTGIGVFKSIQKGFKLKSEEEALDHLLKGKQTTMPKAHSGQGLFFTSKIADSFSLRSGKLQLIFEKNDIRLKNSALLKGTEVIFSINKLSRKNLKSLFEQYANEDFEFDRTTYPIFILERHGAISRSQARRLTVGLENFDRIILDFKKVTELGQGFSDEIFRVFQSKHPKIVIEVRNANSAVDFMIKRAIKGIEK